MKKYISRIVFWVFILCAVNTYAQPPKKKVWNFNDLEGWVYAHQDDNPDHQCVLEKGKLRIFTRAGSWDRKKVRTADKIYTTGRYTWKTYIPEMGKGDQASVGSWIYCDDHHEIDFEVGYGKQAVLSLLDRLHTEYQSGTVYLSVYENNPHAIKLYQQIGFRFNGKYDSKGEHIMEYHF